MKTDYNINKQVLNKWHEIARLKEIPVEAFNFPVKILKDSSGNSNFSFGVVYSETRARRSTGSQSAGKCPLCRIVKEVVDDPRKNIFPGEDLGDLVATVSDSPVTEGSVLAISRGIEGDERPMYTTKNLNNLQEYLLKLSNLSEKSGLYVLHNSPGGGATLPHHEHWQLVNWGVLYNLAGEVYGSDKQVPEETGVNGVYQIPEHPFAHLAFDISESDRAVRFLERMSTGLPTLADGTAPHILASSNGKIIVMPFRKDVGKSMGSELGGGHVYTKDKGEFDNATYEWCISSRKEGAFLKDAVNLLRLL